jgi:L-asparaginase II
MIDLVQSKPIFAFTRKGITEVVVHGIVAIKRQGHAFVGHDADAVVVTRSLLKPWQALATGGFDGEHDFWTMGFASHSGQSNHIEHLNKLIQSTGAAESELVCPRVMPLDPNVAGVMRAGGQSASRLHHPCAGKHLLMLAAAKKESVPSGDYWHEDHPVQRRIQALVGKEASEKITWVPDSCGLPVAAMTVRAILNMYERLALDNGDLAQSLKGLWLLNPRLVGGQRRLDSDLVEAGEKRALAKEGADGLLMVQTLPSGDEPIAGCFVKIASGYSVAHLGIALWSLLSTRDDLNSPLLVLKDYLRSRLEEWIPKDQTLQILYRPS